MTDMLMVSSSVGMLDWVHSHTTHLWPRVSLCLVLVVRSTSLEHRLFGTSATSNLANHGTRCRRNDLLQTGGELKACSARVSIVRNNDRVVARGLGKSTSITSAVLDVANDATLWHGAHREDVANGESGILSAVDELASIETLRCCKCNLLMLVSERIAKGDFCKRSTTSGVVDNVSYDAL